MGKVDRRAGRGRRANIDCLKIWAGACQLPGISANPAPQVYQGGDSGGPFFVDGKLAGLATAGTANGDPDLPSPSAAITTLAGTKEWIEGVVSGRDKEAILTAETTPEPPKTPQTSADHAWLYAEIAVLGLIAAAVVSRIPGLRGRKH